MVEAVIPLSSPGVTKNNSPGRRYRKNHVWWYIPMIIKCTLAEQRDAACQGALLNLLNVSCISRGFEDTQVNGDPIRNYCHGR